MSKSNTHTWAKTQQLKTPDSGKGRNRNGNSHLTPAQPAPTPLGPCFLEIRWTNVSSAALQTDLSPPVPNAPPPPICATRCPKWKGLSEFLLAWGSVYILIGAIQLEANKTGHKGSQRNWQQG